MSTCPVTTWSLLTRRQYRRYQGLAATGGLGGYVWVLGDSVPTTKYWLVWWCSLIEAVGGTFTNPTQLYVIPNGATLPKFAAGTVPDDPFFLNYQAAANKAAGPGAYGLRVDRYNLGSSGNFNAPAHPGDEVQMLDKPLILGPGETLMGWVQQYTTAPGVGCKLEMRLAISIMDQAEELPLLFSN